MWSGKFLNSSSRSFPCAWGGLKTPAAMMEYKPTPHAESDWFEHARPARCPVTGISRVLYSQANLLNSQSLPALLPPACLPLATDLRALHSLQKERRPSRLSEAVLWEANRP